MIATKRNLFNKILSPHFIKHIENTTNVCIYKLDSYKIPDNIIFSNAKAVTLINCNSSGVTNILKSSIFPNIHRINYLSSNPGNNLDVRFPHSVEWIFPNKDYDFYNFMVMSGKGRKDPTLIKEYIANKIMIDGKNEFDISFKLDLNIPEFGVTNGDWWRSQFYEYLVKKENETKNNYKTALQETEERTLEIEHVSYLREVNRFD
jgi:hypothetical protein